MIPLVLLLITISMVGIVGALLFNFRTLDRLSEENMRQRVSIALDVEKKRQQDLLEEYSYWDEAHDKTILIVDPAWIDDNTGKYLIDKYDLEFTIAVKGNLVPSVISTSERQSSPQFDQLLDNGLRQLVESILNNRSKSAVSAYIPMDSTVYLVSVGAFLDEKTETISSDHSFLVFGQRIDRSHIEQIAETYKLPSLTILSQGKPPVDENLQIHDQSGNAVAYLTWDVVRPSRSQLPDLLMTVALLFLISMIVIRHMLVKEREYQKLYEKQLYLLATKDFLTGISNRREFLHLAEREIQRAVRADDTLSVLLMDIDRFKKINDSFGHNIGDKVLVKITDIIRNNLRDFDIFARIGGEEFVIVLPSVKAEQALETAERLRRLIEQSLISLKSNEQVKYTISAGVAEWNGEENLERLMVRADDALYKAKRSGRNKSYLSPSRIIGNASPLSVPKASLR